MSEKLSERMEQHSLHCARCSDPDSDAVYTPREIGELARLLRQAARIVRAVETAPECVVETVSGFDESERPVLDVYVKNGKRVKLVEVE